MWRGCFPTYVLASGSGLLRSGFRCALEEATTLLHPVFPLGPHHRKSADQTIHIASSWKSFADGCVSGTPRLGRYALFTTATGLIEHYERMLAESQFPLLLDNDPDLVGRIGGKGKRKNIRTAILKRLAQNPVVAGLLHRGDLRRGLNYQRAVRARPDSSSTTPVSVTSSAAERERRPLHRCQSLPTEWRLITQASVGLDEGTARRRVAPPLWEAGQRIRALQKLYGPAPRKLSPQSSRPGA